MPQPHAGDCGGVEIFVTFEPRGIRSVAVSIDDPGALGASSHGSVASSSARASSADAGAPPLRRFRYHETLAGKYRLEKSLARGGMGWVFLATQLPLGRQVAVKVLTCGQQDAAFRQRFLLEASTCAKLQHPNIVTIHDYGESERGDLFMAMEYLAGSSLSYLLAKSGRLPVSRALRITLQVARALRVAHKAGVVHRDLKPANIMLLEHDDDAQDFVKVVDFGLAKLFEGGPQGGAIELTRAGTMLGSPRYMAPEQIRNRDIDPRTDIYSLGVILFYMLTGRPPFMGDNATDILAQHLRDPVPPMAEVAGDLEVPHELEEVVRRCLGKDAADRYPTVDALIADLKAVHSHAAEGTLPSDSFESEVKAAARLASDLNTPLPFPDPEDVDDELPSATRAVRIEDASGAPRRRAAGWRWPLVAAALLLIGVGIFYLGRGGAPTEPAATAPGPAPAVALTELVIRTDPPGLTLVDEAGAELGTAPLTLPRPQAQVPLRVRAVSGPRTSRLLRVIPAAGELEVTLDLRDWVASAGSDDPPPEAAAPVEAARSTEPRRARAAAQARPERSAPAASEREPEPTRPAPPNEVKPEAKPTVGTLDDAPVVRAVDAESPRVGIIEDPRPKVDLVDDRSGPSVGLVDEGEAPRVGVIEE